YDDAANLLFAGGAKNRLFRVNNVALGTITGNSFTINASFPETSVSALKVDPNTPNRLVVAVSIANNTSVNAVPGLFSVTNSNTATPVFTQMNLPAAVAAGAGYYISSVDIENGNANHILLTLSNYGIASVYETLDGGTNWTSLDNNGVNLPNIPVRWGVFVPIGSNPGNGVNAVGGIMLATESGVFSTNVPSGTTTVWTANNTGFGNVRTDMLDIRAVDRTVVTATHGRGVFTGTLFAGSLVPVTFKSFTGKAEAKQNKLIWTVENEVDNTGYELQRKYATGDFEKIGFVPANLSSTSNSYSFDDRMVDLGKDNAYYRLKQIDKDGKISYSTVVQLGRKQSAKFIEYMSADRNTLLLRISNSNVSQTIRIRLMDASGKVLRNSNTSYQTQQIDISGLAAGTYLVEVSNSKGEKFTGRFIK
ncbi:MAG: T9SS type A sorting domain-containing protein, partial [Gemmatimonadaceae bacterium]|nr:T9SS type A sorting domain-containing protein [Chitinophagaceae bacterium]